MKGLLVAGGVLVLVVAGGAAAASSGVLPAVPGLTPASEGASTAPEEEIRTALSRHFRYLGYDIVTACNGREALDILAEQKVGPGYRFHISSLRSSQGDKGKSVVGVVIAWKEDDIQRIPVHWLE